ncbi:hypothetical protein KEM54_003231 [Ascosphaera aggregata]|nr:hypothetical protein KEM54_003231 [Ascosphaera aggregata]
MEDNQVGQASGSSENVSGSSAAVRTSLSNALKRSNAGSLESPLRHHARKVTGNRIQVKETLNARSKYTNSEDDGTAEHFINQYLIRHEIGRGSFGAVHLAVDQFGREYAVKEFSKARLRKRAQSHFLRHPRRLRPENGVTPAGKDFNSPLHRHPSESGGVEVGSCDPLYLIRQEIAIMKKLQHHNLVSLFEVLDDPAEDSLYMVMELCKQGVVMKVGLGIQADPYDNERCRHCFRDLLLGIEYLHAQGIAHRDIKPDNCLLTSGGVLKIVDFGVSEMFEKESAMYTAKSAGSPAFLPPELCVAGHGDVSGRAADIWSMGVTLYCLKYGRLPFEKPGVLELYVSIRNDEVVLPGETDGNFIDLMRRILEKDPDKRITMPELREHLWVTKNGVDPLLPEEENTAVIIPNPTDEEISRAITNSMRQVLALIKAVQCFKKLIADPEEQTVGSILGQDAESQIVQPPELMDDEEESKFSQFAGSNSAGEGDTDNGRLAYHINPEKRPLPRAPHLRINGALKRSPGSNDGLEKQGDKSQHSKKIEAQNILNEIINEREKRASPQERWENSRYLFVGPSNHLDDLKEKGEQGGHDGYFNNREPAKSLESVADIGACADQDFCLSESPSAADDDIYEIAYRAEIERIRKQFRKPAPTVYLTRRVEDKPDSEALLKLAHDEGAVVSAPSNGRRIPTNEVQGRTVQEDSAQIDAAHRATGPVVPLRGKRLP